ncbi:MAG: CBS domain-containing protein, partial [Flavobacteriaceae bacterium]
MKNSISERVADFLENFPPFNELHQKDLQLLASEVSIVYKEKDSIIFKEEESPHDFFYVVHKGAVVLKKSTDSTMVDLCDEGDIFGLRPLMANEAYKMDATAFEESILYAIPIVAFKPLAQRYEEVGNFLIESFASNTRNPYSKTHRGSLYGEAAKPENNKTNPIVYDLQPISYSKKIVSCSQNSSIKSLAELMDRKQVGAMLVLKNKLPIGIITDKDIRNQIATGKFPITAKAKEIMTSPVITYGKKMTVAQAQMAMMKSNISYLCITKDGTPNTVAVGILSKHDLMLEM